MERTEEAEKQVWGSFWCFCHSQLYFHFCKAAAVFSSLLFALRVTHLTFCLSLCFSNTIFSWLFSCFALSSFLQHLLPHTDAHIPDAFLSDYHWLKGLSRNKLSNSSLSLQLRAFWLIILANDHSQGLQCNASVCGVKYTIKPEQIWLVFEKSKRHCPLP